MYQLLRIESSEIKLEIEQILILSIGKKEDMRTAVEEILWR